MGFVSAGQQGDVFFWDLINISQGQSGGNRIHDKDFTQKNVLMTSVVSIPGRSQEIYCCGNDSKIWNNNNQKDPYEAQAIMSQLCMT